MNMKKVKELNWCVIMLFILLLFITGMFVGSEWIRTLFLWVMSLMIFICTAMYQILHLPVLAMILAVFMALLHLS